MDRYRCCLEKEEVSFDSMAQCRLSSWISSSKSVVTTLRLGASVGFRSTVRYAAMVSGPRIADNLLDTRMFQSAKKWREGSLSLLTELINGLHCLRSSSDENESNTTVVPSTLDRWTLRSSKQRVCCLLAEVC